MEFPLFCCLPDCRLEVSVQPEDPAAGLLTQVLLVFLSLQANAEMVPKLLLRVSHAALKIKI
jgi:hypothetical protein